MEKIALECPVSINISIFFETFTFLCFNATLLKAVSLWKSHCIVKATNPLHMIPLIPRLNYPCDFHPQYIRHVFRISQLQLTPCIWPKQEASYADWTKENALALRSSVQSQQRRGFEVTEIEINANRNRQGCGNEANKKLFLSFYNLNCNLEHACSQKNNNSGPSVGGGSSRRREALVTVSKIYGSDASSAHPQSIGFFYFNIYSQRWDASLHGDEQSASGVWRWPVTTYGQISRSQKCRK